MSSTPIQTPQPLQLDQLYTNSLNSQICKHQLKGTLLRVAAIVCAIAAGIIFAAASFISLGLLATPPTWLIAAGMITAFAATQGLSLWGRANPEFEQAADLKTIAAKAEEIKDWQEPQIAAYFAERGLTLTTVTTNDRVMEALRKINSEHPLQVLLPVIARELVQENDAQKMQELLTKYKTDFPKHFDDQFTHHYFNTIIQAQETLALTLFKQACDLHTLQHPDQRVVINDKNVYGLVQENEIKTLVALHAKDASDRAIEYATASLLEIAHPRLFIEFPVQEANLTVEQITQLTPQMIRQRIFG